MIQINFYSNEYFFQILLLQITSISYIHFIPTTSQFKTFRCLVFYQICIWIKLFSILYILVPNVVIDSTFRHITFYTFDQVQIKKRYFIHIRPIYFIMYQSTKLTKRLEGITIEVSHVLRYSISFFDQIYPRIKFLDSYVIFYHIVLCSYVIFTSYFSF